MTRMSNGSITAVLLALLCAGGAHGANLFPPTLQAGTNALQRVGVGALRRWMIKGCDIALYAPAGTSRSTILEDLPRCLWFHYYHPIKAEQFAVAAWDTLERGIPARKLAALRPSVEALHGLYRNVSRGDEYTLLYLPGVGTTLSLNGNKLGTVEGADFAAAYFGIWLGEKPIDDRLRAGLLAGAEAL